MLYCLFSPAVQTLLAKCRMYNQYKKVIALTWITLLLSTIASLVLTYCMKDKLLGRIIGTYIIVAIIDFAFFLYIIIRGKKINAKMCIYACAMSIPLLVHELSGVLLNSSDRIIINQLCGAERAALYSIAYTIAMIISVLLSSLNQAWVPWFFEKLEKKQLSEIKSIANKYVSLFTTGCILLMLVGPELILIFGGKSYISAEYVIPPVCLAVELQFVYTLYVNIEFYMKKTVYISIATLLATLINIVLNFCLIPHCGYEIAAYTTVIGYLFAYVFHLFVCKKTKYKNLFDEKIIFINLVLCTISMILIIQLYHFNNVRYLVIIILIFILLFITKNNWKKIINLIK